ncbi:MAG: MBOAT family O-acyltransferase [Imperialibacter sp.]|uniref:MBOAT family O-acyltransferase n=1 Tax=Imperialibacter sp. TaxID=2038411 RepID=UPI0032EFE635
MLFNSIEFGVFLILVFFLYWFVFNKNLRLQNGLILIASYFFYGWWDWRFLTLILLSSLLDYIIGIGIHHSSKKVERKILLWVSVLVNIGILGFFKYFNFFLDTLYDVNPGLQSILGFNSLSIILPVGISFYTFQTLSYSFDVYNKKIRPTYDFLSFGAYVSFFPQLVAGPIERASHLLPQFQKGRTFCYPNAINGLRQILWGLVKKVVIANQCAKYADTIFDGSDLYGGSTLLVGAVFFAFQIYGDFSGYSDIAIGTARLFGFDLTRNFAFPYFSRDIAEFWRRWHISLSTWFRDYVYIPLGGSRMDKTETIRNIFVIFLLSGLWHGANWTFIAWGFLNALYFLPYLLLKQNRKNLGVVAENSFLPSLKDVINILSTFFLICLAWIFFRSQNLTQAIGILDRIFSLSVLEIPEFRPWYLFLDIIIFMIIEWLGRRSSFAIENLSLNIGKPLRYAFYYIIILIIFWKGGSEEPFIYFQF